MAFPDGNSRSLVRRFQRCAAMTLLELLVVVSIVVVLLAASVPLLKPAIEDGKIRESARQLNVYLQVARARAIETGRTTAVYLERSEPGSNICNQLFIAQSPRPYSGDFSGALATEFIASTLNANWNRVVFRDAVSGPGFGTSNNSATLPAIVQIGDFIKFDYKGHLFEIKQMSNPGNIPVWVEVDVSGQSLPPNLGGLKYQVFRQPIKSIASPLQLTAGVAIDLRFSGIGATIQYDATGKIEMAGSEFQSRSSTDGFPVLIGFGPSGAVDHVTYTKRKLASTDPDTVVTEYPDGVIHFLIGKQENVDVPVDFTPETPVPLQVTSSISSESQDYTKNVPVASSVWISIAPKTGAIGSAENAWALANDSAPSGQINFADSFRLAREFAQAGQLAGGN